MIFGPCVCTAQCLKFFCSFAIALPFNLVQIGTHTLRFRLRSFISRHNIRVFSAESPLAPPQTAETSFWLSGYFLRMTRQQHVNNKKEHSQQPHAATVWHTEQRTAGCARLLCLGLCFTFFITCKRSPVFSTTEKQ